MALINLFQLKLADTYVKHRPVLKKFFHECISEEDNKLSLACYAYLHSEWFYKCCLVAQKSYEVFVNPLKKALGIDEHKKEHSEYRSWEGLRIFFSEKLNELENLSQTSAEMSDEICSSVKLSDF